VTKQSRFDVLRLPRSLRELAMTIFRMRLLRFTRNDNFSYGIATLPMGARNDILSNAFILALFTAFVPENIGDIYLE